MPIVVNNQHPQDQRIISTWLQRQIHDEFEILAKQNGKSKARLWRELIEQFVESELKKNGIGGDNG